LAQNHEVGTTEEVAKEGEVEVTTEVTLETEMEQGVEEGAVEALPPLHLHLLPLSRLRMEDRHGTFSRHHRAIVMSAHAMGTIVGMETLPEIGNGRLTMKDQLVDHEIEIITLRLHLNLINGSETEEEEVVTMIEEVVQEQEHHRAEAAVKGLPAEWRGDFLRQRAPHLPSRAAKGLVLDLMADGRVMEQSNKKNLQEQNVVDHP
jgi:hypothetical protein